MESIQDDETEVEAVEELDPAAEPALKASDELEADDEGAGEDDDD